MSLRPRTAHAIAVLLAGIAIALFLTSFLRAAGVVLAIEAILVVWSIESTRNVPANAPEKRP